MRPGGRLMLLLLFVPLVIFIFAQARSSKPESREMYTRKKAAVLNILRAHDEVVVSLMWTLSRFVHLDVDLYFPQPRFGFEDLLLLFRPVFPLMKDHRRFLNATTPLEEDIIFLASCDFDLLAFVRRLNHSHHTHQISVACLVHNPDALTSLSVALRTLNQRTNLLFLCLSDHVGHYLSEKVLPQLLLAPKPAVHLFVPIFPFQPFRTCEERSVDCNASFAVQGLFDGKRRSYDGLFKNLSSSIENSSSAWRDFRLVLLGSGPPPVVPDSIRPFTVIGSSFSFFRYYEALHHNAALLTIFAYPVYYTKKSSSSVAASLIAEVPLLASKKVLASYRYLDSNAVYRHDDELHGMELVLNMSWEMKQAKRAALLVLKKKLLRANVALLARLFDLDLLLEN